MNAPDLGVAGAEVNVVCRLNKRAVIGEGGTAGDEGFEAVRAEIGDSGMTNMHGAVRALGE